MISLLSSFLKKINNDVDWCDVDRATVDGPVFDGNDDGMVIVVVVGVFSNELMVSTACWRPWDASAEP